MLIVFAWAHLCVLECVCVHKLAYKWATACQRWGVVKNRQAANRSTRGCILVRATLMSLACIRSHCCTLLMRTAWVGVRRNPNVMTPVATQFCHQSQNLSIYLYVYLSIYLHKDAFSDKTRGCCDVFWMSVCPFVAAWKDKVKLLRWKHGKLFSALMKHSNSYMKSLLPGSSYRCLSRWEEAFWDLATMTRRQS